MSGIFACPECGQELSVEDSSPGREVQCEGCSTWVEVPFLPRGGGWKRRRRVSEAFPWRDSKLLRGAIVFATVVLLGLAATKMIGGKVRSDKERVLAELLASADEAESTRRYDVALRELEGALAQARAIESKGSGRMIDLETRRDRVSLLEAEVRLAAVDALDPDHAVGESLTIAERAKHDPALAPLAGTIEAQLDESRKRQAEADLRTAARALKSGKDVEAFLAAQRLHDRAGRLPEIDSRRFRDQAQAVIEAAVGHSGVALPPVTGSFVAGSTDAYTETLERHRVEVLKARGYLSQPRRPSPWASLWDEKAPYRLAVHVLETQEGYYLQSRNRTTQIDGTWELTHGDIVVWKTRIATQTRMPLPDLPAYAAGHIATSDKHNPVTERRLHKDALDQFVEQSVKKLQSLPTLEKAAR